MINQEIVPCARCGTPITSISNRNRALRRGYGYCSHSCAAPRAMSQRDYFFTHVSPEPMTGCWLWAGAIDHYGYGQMCPKRRRNDKSFETKAHRASWALHFGQIPAGMLVCHACDVRLCVNPDHLFLGSVAENNRDARSKSRHIHGERHPFAKLTSIDVGEIRTSTLPGRTLARKFGLSESTVSQIRHHKRWTSIAGVTR